MHHVQVIRVIYRVNGIAYVGSVVSSNRSIGVSGGPQYGPTVGQNSERVSSRSIRLFYRLVGASTVVVGQYRPLMCR